MNFKRPNPSLSPVLPAKQARVNEACILCTKPCDEKQKCPSDDDWCTFRENAEKWRGLDKYGTAADTVDWNSGPLGKLWHKSCKAELSGERKLQQAIRRKEKSTVTPSDEKTSCNDEERPATRKSVGPVHDSSLCIWCMTGYNKKKPDKRDELRLLVNRTTWQKIVASVPFIEDKAVRTRMEVLANATTEPLTAGINYHARCYLNYVTKAGEHEDEGKNECLGSLNLAQVRELFLKEVEERIFGESEPATLKQLLREYESFLLDHGIIRTSLKTYDIRIMLEEKFGEKIGFQDRYRRNESTLVFSKDDGGTFLEAAMNCWGVTDERLLEIAAKRLRENVTSTAVPMKWPQSAAELCHYREPHSLLHNFVKEVSAKSDDKVMSESLYLTDLLQSHITGKRTPLKTKFAVTLHGSVRSKVLSELAADMGVAATYKDVMYLYDAWALNDLSENSVCPPELAEEKPGTAILDNDNWQTEDITGETTAVNRTNMMFVQPEKWEAKKENDACTPHVQRKDVKTALNNLVVSELKIKPCPNNDRGEPAVYESVDINPSTTDAIRSRMMAHALIRSGNQEDEEGCQNPDDQEIPSFTGFMNSIMPYDEKSNAYYFLSLPKNPSKSVVYTLLVKVAEAAKLKNMPFVQVVGDQPVYAFIVELKNENPEKFKKILPVLGSFHIQLTFMSAIHKRIQCSNIEDLLSDAGLITSGSVHKALKGKNYYQALRLYKLYYEALVRLLIKYGKDSGIECPDSVRDLIDAIRDVEDTRDNRHVAFETIIQSPEFIEYIRLLRESLDVPEHHMAKYVLSIMDMIEILFMNIDSLRRKDWVTFKSSLRLMMPWLIIYDSTNYGRWLPVFWLDMSTLPAEFDRYMPEIFSQSMTGNPYSAIPPDLWIECTMNRGSKLKAGWKYLLKNEKGLMVHIRNINNVNLVRNSLTNLICEVNLKGAGHKENTRPRRRLDEKAVQDVIALMQEWGCEPFDLSQQQLRTFMSGELADERLVNDLETAHKDGEAEIRKNFDQRLFSQEASIYDKLGRKNRWSFANKPTSDNKENERKMETEAAMKIIDLYTKDKKNSPESIFQYRLTDECLSIYNENGTMRKCQKSKLVDVLHFKEVNVRNYICLLDMSFIWRKALPKSDEYTKPDGTRLTWNDYATKMFNLIVSRHAEAKQFILVNDYYGEDVVSCKDGETNRRYQRFVGGNTPNIYPSPEKELPTQKTFKNFFQNKANKRRLQDFLGNQFRKFCCDTGKDMTYVLRGKSISLTSFATTPAFENFKTEADNSIFYIYSQIRKMEDSSPVVVDAEDTDILVTSAYVTTKTAGQLFLKRKKGLFDCSELCDAEMASVAIRFHVMTGCDAVSSFFGKGKKGIWKNVQTNKENGINLLKELTIASLRQFTIQFIYNDRRSKTLTEMRENKWNNMKKKCFARLGIDEDSHELRCQRVRYLVKQIESYESKYESENPLTNGYVLDENMSCVPQKYSKPAMPDSVTALQDDQAEIPNYLGTDNDSETEDEEDIDIND